MEYNIDELSVLARERIEQKDYNDIDKNKSDLLFPFMEQALFYDALDVGSIIIAPAATSDGQYKIDYGLRNDKSDKYKSCVKVVEYGTNFADEYLNIRKALVMTDTEYVIITDCYNYEVLEYKKDDDKLTSLSSFNICAIEPGDRELLKYIQNPIITRQKQEYAEYDDEEDFDEVLPVSYDYEEEEETTHKVYVEEIYKRKINKRFLILGFLILITLIIGGFIVWNIYNDKGFSNIPIIGNALKIDRGQLDGDLLASAQGTSLSLEFKSKNIPDGGIIKFEVICDNYRDSVYGQIVNKSTSVTYQIPSGLSSPDLSIVTYLRFDEPNFAQPDNVRKEFGQIGEKIVAKDGAPDKFAITFLILSGGNTNFDPNNIGNIGGGGNGLGGTGGTSGNNGLDSSGSNGGIGGNGQVTVDEKRQQELGEIDIRIDKFGNIKALPKGMDMDNVRLNITEARNIYPQIFYDSKSSTANFYVVIGTVNQMQVIRFTDIIFYADGHRWTYPISSNPKDLDVSGGIAREWVFFHDSNIPTLVNDIHLLATSKTSTITFKGDKIKDHNLSNKEKNTLLYMLYIYSEYFDNGDSKPERTWIERSVELSGNSNQDSTGGQQGAKGTVNGSTASGSPVTGTVSGSTQGEQTTQAQSSNVNQTTSSGSGGTNNASSNIIGEQISLSGVKSPTNILQRNSGNEKAYEELLKEIQSAKLSGQTVNQEKEKELINMQKRYIVLNDDMKKLVISEINQSNAVDTVEPTLENKDYYKLTFIYEEGINIEAGRIGHAYIFTDKTMYIPIKSLSVNADDKTYAVFRLHDNVYTSLITYFTTTEYTII